MENISFDNLNGIEAEEIILTSDLSNNLSGEITFKQPLEVKKLNILNNQFNDAIELEDLVTIDGRFTGE